MVMPETPPRMALQPQPCGEGGDAKGSLRSDSGYCERGLPITHASLTALQESVKALVTNVTYGLRCGVCLARLDRDGSWEKMFPDSTLQQGALQMTLEGSTERFSLTWPRWGMLLDGVVMGLSMWERPTDGTGYSLWPTPQAVMVDNLSSSQPDSQGRYQRQTGSDFGINLLDAVHLWPTPQSRDWKGQSQWGQHQPMDNLNNAVMWAMPTPRANLVTDCTTKGATRNSGNIEDAVAKAGSIGQLNPEFVEFLMGFPKGWTSVD